MGASRRFVAAASVTAVVVVASVAPRAAGAQGAPARDARQPAANMAAPPGLRPNTFQPPLMVADPAGYARAKAEAGRAALGTGGVTPSRPAAPATPSAPTTSLSWQGISDSGTAPSDSTSAVGTTRFVEFINSRFAIYNKTSTTPLSSGSLIEITGCAPGFFCTDAVFDPQILFDASRNRFFFAADDVIDNNNHFLAFGFSKTASPSKSSDWCSYSLAFGSSFPDFPKLGDTKDFQLIGYNKFDGSTFSGSEVEWLSKPGTGSTCPAATTFTFGSVVGLKNADGSQAFTPVPAHQIDKSSTGWIVARPATLPTTGGTFLTTFKVTTSATGTAIIPATGSAVTVPAYLPPANAPQQGTTDMLDTSDARNTQAVSATDPAHGTATGLWTQHTVFGGAGAEVRWYEINPAAHNLFQSGTLTDPALFTFNAAISPDRVAHGTTKLFGSNMVLDANTSSSSTPSTLEIVSKLGANPQSAPIAVAQSSGPDIAFGCNGGTCRWGDYASASPDPSVTSGTAGVVWGSTMLSFNDLFPDPRFSNWTTWNFAANP